MHATRNDPVAEAEIRAVLDRWAAAFAARSTESALAVHAPEIVSFDLVPPLRFTGLDEYGAAWHAVFEQFAEISMELRDVNVIAGADLAVTYSFNRFVATAVDGTTTRYWFRWTAVLRRRDDRWLIVHDHQSLPTDFATGESVLDLEPDAAQR